MALADQFQMASGSFALFAVWSLGYWLTSETLTGRRTYLCTRAAKRNRAFTGERRKYLVLEWGISILILGMSGCCVVWAHEFRQQSERENVFDHLTVKQHIPAGSEDDPMYTMFTVINGGAFPISKKHQISCFTRFAVGNDGTSYTAGVTSWFLNGHLVFGTPEQTPHGLADSIIGPGGDAQTDACLRFFNYARGTDCVDMTLTFWYTLESQPDYEQEKKFRYVAYKGKNGSFYWYPEPVDSGENYCSSYLKTH